MRENTQKIETCIYCSFFLCPVLPAALDLGRIIPNYANVPYQILLVHSLYSGAL